MKKRLSFMTLLAAISLPTAIFGYFPSETTLKQTEVNSLQKGGDKAVSSSQWTVLVYINADNNLHDAGLKDIKEMEAIGSTEDVNILVQFDGKKKGDSRRYYVMKGRSKVVEDFRKTGGEVDMGDVASLVDFILWGAKQYPAEKYFVIVWNHGNGALNSAKFKNYIKAISFDETSGTYISTPDLGLAFESVKRILGRDIDVYGSDACLMGMIEVAYELKDNVDFIVGSQAVEPEDGWPYDDLLSLIVKNPLIEGGDLSAALVDFYNASYRGIDNVTLSSVSAKGVEMLALGIDAFVGELIELINHRPEKVKKAASQAASFTYASHRDLGGFLKELRFQITGYPGFLSSIDSVIDSYYESIISAMNTGGIYKDSTGLAIWLPLSADAFDYNKSEYVTLKFGRDTQWLEFLEHYHGSGRSDFLAMR